MGYKVAINGFGRIGRLFFRASIDQKDFDIVAVNDVTLPQTLAHLLKYDSVFGRMKQEIEVKDDNMIVDGKKVRVLAQKNPEDLPWTELGVNLVVESTGLFHKREDAQKHLNAGAAKVVISAPATNPDITIVMGVNDDAFQHDAHHIISNASCTTNCIAPPLKILHDRYRVLRGNMTTVHSYTNDQRILDLPHKDMRRARAAALNIIPTTTGAAKAVGLVIPELAGKIAGSALRVPTPDVSLVDLVVNLEKPATVDGLKKDFIMASQNELKGIMEYSELPLVSTDILGNSHSSIIDGEFITVIEGNMVKILAWYDNEWGYACRLRDLIGKIASRS